MTKKKQETAIKAPVSRDAVRKTIQKRLEKKEGVKDPFLHYGGIPTFASLSTGILDVDIALGTRGFMRGRVVEIFGWESTGKTLLAMHAVIEAQKRYGLPSFWVDAEHTFDPAWFVKNGGDMELLDVLSDFYGCEVAWNSLADAVGSGAYAYGVVDSLAAMIPIEELNKDVGDSQALGGDAKLNKRAIRKCLPRCIKRGTNLLVVNHIIEKPGVSFGSPETTPGGKALKFYSSQRVELLRPLATDTRFDENKEPLGHRARGRVKKNKLAPPGKKFEFDFTFVDGVNNIPPLLEKAAKIGLYESKRFYFEGGDKASHSFKTVAEVREVLSTDGEFRREVWDKVLDEITGTKAMEYVAPSVIDIEEISDSED